MKHITQGDQHVLMLTNAEYNMLMRMISNGSGDDPTEIGARSGAERTVWNRITQLAFNGTIPD